ncbi:MAG TPA: macro domain-containing protein [Anaerolineales bacterium]|nr:macro domain-containing protein [Anaerolineae bacterium]HIQ02497.1 macro domain-containing protein [Anaerolineales bacterium]
MQVQINRTVLELVEGDITELEADAIVNAANERLAHGGGVAGVIARMGGPVIQRESDEWVRRHGPVPTGSAAITSGGRLRARYVIHAVGPVYDGTPRSARLLASAVHAALRLADERGLRSIALPAISTGIFGYPMEEAAEVMLRAAIAYLQRETGLELVIFCLYGRPALTIFITALTRLTEGRTEEPT